MERSSLVILRDKRWEYLALTRVASVGSSTVEKTEHEVELREYRSLNLVIRTFVHEIVSGTEIWSKNSVCFPHKVSSTYSTRESATNKEPRKVPLPSRVFTVLLELTCNTIQCTLTSEFMGKEDMVPRGTAKEGIQGERVNILRKSVLVFTHYRNAMSASTLDAQLQVLSLSDESISFSLIGADASVANALRRVMISEVPTIAIELVDIKANTSVLSDEFLSHRLGLIPLLSDHASRMLYNRDCSCESECDQCSVRLQMSVRNTGDSVLEVTSRDLLVVSGFPDVVPVHYSSGNSVLICKLGRNQELVLEATARKGIAKDHAKWSPVAVATFQYQPNIGINYELMDHMPDNEKVKFVESCPTGVYSYDHQQRQINVDNPGKCTFCDECVLKAKSLGRDALVSVSMHEDRMIFNVESTGVLRPEVIVRTAIQIVMDKLATLDDACDSLPGGRGVYH